MNEHQSLIAALEELFDAFGIRGVLCGVNEHFGAQSAIEIIRFAALLKRKADSGQAPRRREEAQSE